MAKSGVGCEWIAPDSDGQLVLTTEPDSSTWLRFKGWLLSPLIPEEQL